MHGDVEREREQMLRVQRNLLDKRDEQGRLVIIDDHPVPDPLRVASTLVQSAGVPARFAGRLLTEFEDIEQYQAAIGAVRTAFRGRVPNQVFQIGGLHLAGAVRTGKSSFAGAVCALAIKCNTTVQWLPYPKLIEHHVADVRLRFEDEEYVEKVDQLREEEHGWSELYELLVIDDVEQVAPPANVQQRVRDSLHTIVRRRWENGLFTVITTNQPEKSDHQTQGRRDAFGPRYEEFIDSEFLKVKLISTERLSAGR